MPGSWPSWRSSTPGPSRRPAGSRSARDLPVTPAPGFGGILLGGIVAAYIGELDPDLFDDLDRLTRQLEAGHRIPQPRLRHRFQTDRVGLQRSVHRLVGTRRGAALRDRRRRARRPSTSWPRCTPPASCRSAPAAG